MRDSGGSRYITGAVICGYHPPSSSPAHPPWHPASSGATDGAGSPCGAMRRSGSRQCQPSRGVAWGLGRRHTARAPSAHRAGLLTALAGAHAAPRSANADDHAPAAGASGPHHVQYSVASRRPPCFDSRWKSCPLRSWEQEEAAAAAQRSRIGFRVRMRVHHTHVSAARTLLSPRNRRANCAWFLIRL